MAQENKFILWFDQIRIDDIPLVGGKNASLGEMYQELTVQGVKIPNGFATTSGAYWHLLEAAGILDKLKETLQGWIRRATWMSLQRKAKRLVSLYWEPRSRKTSGQR